MFAITHENFTESLQLRTLTSRFLFRFVHDCILFLKMFEVLKITICPTSVYGGWRESARIKKFFDRIYTYITMKKKKRNKYERSLRNLKSKQNLKWNIVVKSIDTKIIIVKKNVVSKRKLKTPQNVVYLFRFPGYSISFFFFCLFPPSSGTKITFLCRI